MRVGDLDRNDVPAAMKLFEEEWTRTKGEPSPDLVQTLYMLQDDTAKLRRAVTAFLKRRAGSTS